ncbi:hypothetical protein [Blastococcus colisei]|uniref:hypothetical protein n=1 Tax=Blastococcus colisei TaxID=1564162 RepID=UPI001B86CE76|nr:hypothetical protein [Blastococcus colisei]
MAEVLLFHHALGLTPGIRSFADRLRAAGHVVHVPDLFEGRTFTDLSDGVAHAQQIGFGTVVERGIRAASGLPDELVYAGFSPSGSCRRSSWPRRGQAPAAPS